MTSTYDAIERMLNDALRSFLVHRNKSGFRNTIKAMKLVWDNQNRMLNLKRDVYEAIAATDRRIDGPGVSSAIQRVAEKAWHNNKALLLAYNKSLVYTPTNLEFLEILLQFLEDPNGQQYLKPNKE